jgi:gamma-glutamyltranspeptidase/glutathione hydrolase
MGGFAAKPGVPNLPGLMQVPANVIAFGKWPLSCMAPTIVLKNEKLFLVLGSPGGSRIITTVANILTDVLAYGLNIQQAVDAPRFHHQWLPDTALVEKAISPDTLQLLDKMGHAMEILPEWSDGECVAVDPATGERLGASDYRNKGKAVGY